MQGDLSEHNIVYYHIADLWCEVKLPQGFNPDELLPSYVPFRGMPTDRAGIPIKVAVHDRHHLSALTDDAHLLARKQLNSIECLSIYESIDHYYIVQEYAYEQARFVGTMVSQKDFSYSTVYLPLDNPTACRELPLFIMTAFAQASTLYGVLLVHSSVVVKQGQAYAFLGPSGTGKSTHSSLWLQAIDSCTLLNDDNPAVRVADDGQVWVYGTPWSGKTPCYKNEQYPLKAFVRLYQAPQNHICPIFGIDAFSVLLPACSSMKWNALLYEKLGNTITEVIQKVPIYRLHCLPNTQAAWLCYESISNKYE